MGITDLWSILAPGFDPRIPFPIFVSEFINLYGRTPRIAIDAYMFIFQSSHSNLQGAERENDIQVRNIMSKLMYLTLLNVSYVMVFDGRYKPQKLRHNEDMHHCISYDDQLNEFQKIAFKNENYIEDSLCTPLINRLIEIFRANKMDFIQSPGEAEAECAMLQKFGVVDFVLTKDTDVFVFGATKVLRNFSRSEQDLAISSTSNSVKDYYVTPVDMAKVTKETGLDYQRLILVATLRGGDYSSGMNNIGITRATKIALCGTKFATFFHLSPRKTRKKREIKFYEPLPDFSKLLVDCFIDRGCLNAFDPFALIKGARIRRMELERFTNLLNQCINSRSRDIFDMNIKFPSPLFIDEYFTLLYLFPIVSPQLFKFVPYTLSFSELMINNDLTVPESCFMLAHDPKAWIESVPRFNDMLKDKNIGFLELSMRTDELGNARIINCTTKNSQNICERRSKSVIPDGYKYNIKSIITKILSWVNGMPILREMIKITNKKSINHIEFLMLKFESKRIKNVLINLNDLPKMFSETENETENETMLPHKDKVESLWLPRNLVELINSEMVQNYEVSITVHEKEKIKGSPRKHKTVQRTTLDTLGLASQKHGKNEFRKEDNNTNIIKTQGSPLKTMGLLKAKSISPKKYALLPGQPLVTSFFPNYKHVKENNPFIENDSQINKIDSLFVKDRYEGKNKEIQDNTTSIQYGKLKLEKSRNSNLHYEEHPSNEDMMGSPKRKAPSLAQDISSLQSSPSKRRHVKEKMRLSPDSSPIKQHSGFERHDVALLVPVQDRGSSSPKPMLTTSNRGMPETRANSVSTALDIIHISDSDSEIDSSSLMEINLSTFQNKS